MKFKDIDLAGKLTGAERQKVLKHVSKIDLGDDYETAEYIAEIVDQITPTTTLKSNLRTAVEAIANARFPKAFAEAA